LQHERVQKRFHRDPLTRIQIYRGALYTAGARIHRDETVKRNLLIFVTTRLVDVRGREVTIGNDAETPADVKPAPETAAK
jgi:hypothetical protein